MRPFLRPFRADDFWKLASTIERAVEKFPAWSYLPGALATRPQGFLIWQAGDEIAGFLFFWGEAFKVLGGLFLEPGHEGDLEPLLREAFLPFLAAPCTLALAACDRMGGFSLLSILSSLGLQPVERLELVQEREKTHFKKPSLPPGYRLSPWQPGCFEATVSLLENSNRGSLEGLFLCFPSLATFANCEKLLAGLLEGKHGAFLPDATGLLFDEKENLIAAALMVQSGFDEALLYEIVVARPHQGKNLAPNLIAHLQEAAWKRGLSKIRFDYCGGNRAVRRLFGNSEVGVESREKILVWRSPGYRSSRKNPDFLIN